MLTIKRSTAFKRDYKRELKGQHKAYLDAEFNIVVNLLVHQQPLPAKYVDKVLKSSIYRDLHVRPDLVLIYRRDSTTVYLERIGVSGIGGGMAPRFAAPTRKPNSGAEP